MLKLSLDSLQILDAIDRRGSFAGAGKALHKVPSTISYTVAKLEEDLGVQLFDRVGPRAEPTEAGRALLDEGRHLLRAARELELRVRRVASGWETELTLAVDSVFPTWLLGGYRRVSRGRGTDPAAIDRRGPVRHLGGPAGPPCRPAGRRAG